MFQKPSRYINNEINSVYAKKAVKVALVFPDIYEIGMSHLGLRILYKIINDLPYASAERVFCPWIDAEAAIKANGVLLSSHESKRPLKDFDIVGFSLQYELSYTTVLNMLSLGGIPITTDERLNSSSQGYPLIIAGGPCTVNPMPMSPFIDAFLIGDGEEAIKEITEIFFQWKLNGDGKKGSLLQALSQIEGIFVPYFHRPASEGNFSAFRTSSSPLQSLTPVKRRILPSLDNAPYPDSPIVPFTAIVHDRVNIEVSRGCSMGCRFCQAGMIYRPVRERRPQNVLALAESSLRNTGYEEVALTSLSAGDYSCLLQVVRELNARFRKDHIAISLPSLRVSAINSALLKEISSVRKTGFTIAPEAGTERLRKAINKDFSDEDYERALHILFKEGWLNLKLYFMIGLPTETNEDIEGIIGMALKAVKIAKLYSKRFVNINIGISPFVPKAHTPFQWVGQRKIHELQEMKTFIKQKLSGKGPQIKGHSIHMSLLEAAFSRGDARISPLIEKAASLGCRLDGWTEVFDYRKWEEAMHHTGIDATVYAEKSFDYDEGLPWDFTDIGVTREFLWKEFQKALSGEISTDCKKNCHNCGLDCKSLNHYQQPIIGDQNISGKLGPPVNSLEKRFKPVTIRAEFSKMSSMRFLSHLELVIVFHRAMRRAGFPLEFSKGFHPTPKISFGPPLGVGVAGLKEYFDVEILPPFDLIANKNKLNENLPDGLVVHNMTVVPAGGISLSAFITRYEYKIRGADISSVHRFLSQKEVLVSREKCTINIRNMVEEVSVHDDNSVLLTVTDQGDLKVRLGELIPLLCNKSLEELDITRIALYGWNGEWLKPVERSLQWTAKY